MNSVVSLLAYNTLYYAMYSNVLANEMFLDSAQREESVVSLLKPLGVKIPTKTSAMAIIQIGGVVAIPKYTRFTGTSSTGINYSFYTLEDYVEAESGSEFITNIKLYQASSSEMFGSSVDPDGYQRETTHMNPVSPYGCSKVFGYNIVRNYRNAYNLHANNGILFNHESPRRGSNFVTNKVVKAAVMISLGLSDKLELGNMDSYRDWGHSKDYVKAMHLILQQDKPVDLVVATGESRSVRDMCEYVFSKLNLNYKDYVVQNDKFLRPEELPYLKGDSSKIRSLGWKPEYSFETMMDEMIDYWLNIYKK